MRLLALDSIDIDSFRTDLMARLEYHRDRLSKYERIIAKRYAHGAASPADTGRVLALRAGLRYERAAAESFEEMLAIDYGVKLPGFEFMDEKDD